MSDFAPRDGIDIDRAIEQFSQEVAEMFAPRRVFLPPFVAAPGGDPSPVSAPLPDDRVAAGCAGRLQ